MSQNQICTAIFSEDQNLIRNLTAKSSQQFKLSINELPLCARIAIFDDQSIQNSKLGSENQMIRIFITKDLDGFCKHALQVGRVHLVLRYEFSAVELQSILVAANAISMSRNIENEISKSNIKIQEMVQKTKQDLEITQAVHKKFLPDRFEPISGLKIRHKYLSGQKPGGDYFDVLPYEDGKHVGILMSDSSSYGLSSTFMNILMRTALRFGKDPNEDPALTVRRIYGDLKFIMKDHEMISMFFGVLNKNDLSLRYCSFGRIRFYQNQKLINKTNDPLARGQVFEPQSENVRLRIGDRLTFMTDGFFGAFQTEEQLIRILKQFSTDESINLINECNFKVRHAVNRDDLPPRDCALLVLDMDPQMLRLAK